MVTIRVKICGIKEVEQGQQIVSLGADSLGFICVERSPRYITPQKIREIVNHLPEKVDRVGVFADHSLTEIISVQREANLSSIQLHGGESPDFCVRLRKAIPKNIELIKAFRIKDNQSLGTTLKYKSAVDTLLLDAYHPQILGGTGHTIHWQDLMQFQPPQPWLLAGGLTPDNIKNALSVLQPNGIDLSSGVERSPGDKDLAKVGQLFAELQSFSPQNEQN